MMAPDVVRTVSQLCTESTCFLDMRSGKKAPLKDNDFLASIWRGFLYTPQTSTLTSCSLDRSRHWGSYRTPRLEYGSGANAANLMRRWPASPSPSSAGAQKRPAVAMRPTPTCSSIASRHCSTCRPACADPLLTAPKRGVGYPQAFDRTVTWRGFAA